MTPAENIEKLRQRRDYLTKRIAAKREMSWEFIHDEAERDALTWALGVIEATARKVAE